MTLDHPELLWLAALAPLDLLVGVLRSRRLISSVSALAGPRRRDSARASFLSASVYGAAFSFLFVLAVSLAMAGPAWGSRAVSAERSGLEVAVVLDVSRSMMVKEGVATRLEAAREGVRNVLRSAPGASFSLVATKGGAVLLVPMTEDLEAIDSGLDYADPDTLSEVGTDLEKGIEAGLASFTERSGANRVLLLFSDGGEHGSDATKAAVEAKLRHVAIIAVGVGGAEALPVPGPSGAPLLDGKGVARRSALDPRLLKSLAAMTGGHYVDSGDPGTKVALQAELASFGRGGKRTEYEVQDRSGLFAILALIFLIARFLAAALSIRPSAPRPKEPARLAERGNA